MEHTDGQLSALRTIQETGVVDGVHGTVLRSLLAKGLVSISLTDEGAAALLGDPETTSDGTPLVRLTPGQYGVLVRLTDAQGAAYQTERTANLRTALEAADWREAKNRYEVPMTPELIESAHYVLQVNAAQHDQVAIRHLNHFTRDYHSYLPKPETSAAQRTEACHISWCTVDHSDK